MATAAYLRKIYVKSTSSSPVSGDLCNGAIDFKFSVSKNMLDTTDFADGSGVHTRIVGLEDGSGSISGDWEQSDAPQTLLRTSYAAGTTVYVTDLRDGTNGWTYPCLVGSIDESGSVDGKNEVTFNLVLNGAKIVRP